MRVTGPLLKVLTALLESSGQPVYGFDLRDSTGCKVGTIYPILSRLEEEGWLSSYWEDIDQAEAGRPRRRYYVLTALGTVEARHLLLEYRFGGDLSWS